MRLKRGLWTKTGLLHEKKCSVKTLTWISSQEAAVVVKMFVVADRSVINAFQMHQTPVSDVMVAEMSNFTVR